MRGRAVVATALLVLTLLAATPSAVANAAEPRRTGSMTAGRSFAATSIVMDAETGRVLGGAGFFTRMPPASATKILTGIIAIERLPRGATAVISERTAAIRSGSVLGLEAGQRWPVEDLLYAMLMKSANDAAFAVAERVAGGADQFVRVMNAKAKAIGASTSRFANPNGYHDTNHYVTAYDLALITRYAMRHPDFRAIVGTQTRGIVRPGHAVEEIVNTNGLLGAYAGADGVKTGFTSSAGKVLVGSAVRDGWRLIAVVMKSADPVADVTALLDDGYAAFRRIRVAHRGQQITETTVGPKARALVIIVPLDVHAAVRKGTAVSSRVWVSPNLRAPIRAGANVGIMRFYERGQVIAETPLVAANAVRP